MEYEKELYRIDSPSLKVDIRLGFEGDALRLDGYDLGERVKELRGDSDYEYMITVRETGLRRLYELLQIPLNDKEALVAALSGQVSGNAAYTLFIKYLTEKGIEFESWSY